MTYSPQRLADELRDTSMWAHLDANAGHAAYAAVAAGAYPLDDELRTFVDGEEMAEGGVEEMLADLAAHVQRYGIELQVRLVQAGIPGESDYVVEINGKSCICWRADEWHDSYPWDVASTRPLARVNELLARAGADVRVFVVGAGGNEGFAVLLPPGVADRIRDSGLYACNDVPRLP